LECDVPPEGKLVELEFRDERLLEGRSAWSWRGLSAEHIRIDGPSEYEYKWVGSACYIALHDLRLVDGETALDGAAPFRLLDLRDRMTFLPEGCAISGWSRLMRRSNAFTAVYYDPTLVPEELEIHRRSITALAPILYFENAALRSTLTKIKGLLLDPMQSDEVYAETLGLLVALEVDRLQKLDEKRAPDSGRLSTAQERLIHEYIQENIDRNLSLGELAGVVRLSRFHFVRAFKKTTGLPPHQFVLSCRVERAKEALKNGDAPLKEIAARLGFNSSRQFSATFRKVTGFTPLSYRRARR
jgi:AraC family transcriptional regulator